MPFKPVAAPRPTAGIDDIERALREALPGHDDRYYTDLAERIVITAVRGGYQLASVVDAFIIGAINRGEAGSPTARQKG